MVGWKYYDIIIWGRAHFGIQSIKVFIVNIVYSSLLELMYAYPS